MQNKRKNIALTGVALTGTYVGMNALAKIRTENGTINDDNPYIDLSLTSQKAKSGRNIYFDTIKPMLDKLLSFGGLLVLSPLFAVIAIAVWIDDPGPIFFSQKRIGINKQYVMIHKFRSMCLSAPHDVPTHQLKNPDQYLTKVGRVLRRTSLDELPQIWDIFRGSMSIIGPRPALWNQGDLVAERDRYGANEVLPGLTGLAQIKGRDELEISDKAKLDGDYVKILKQGGVKAFFQDMECFIKTVGSVLKHDGVVEGGTGNLLASLDDWQTKFICRQDSINADEAEDYGFKKTFHINRKRKIKVLITGKGSYIGESFAIYCESHYPNIEVNTIDMVDGSWRKKDFSGYDSVFHVAGIAHADIGKVSANKQKRYYEVNTGLAIEACQKAKEDEVKQFIFMSSMIIYSNEAEYIDEKTVPKPLNFYGDSKWQGDKGVRKLDSEEFHVAVLRSPMIYGRGSKGNYSMLTKLAKVLPLFPDYDNKRSMLYIENLCELVALLVLSGEGGIYFPQNREYSNTSMLVEMIAENHHRKLWKSKVFRPVVKIGVHVPGKIGQVIKKAFGNRYYSQEISTYNGLNYQVVGIEESIRRTEAKSNFKIDFHTKKASDKTRPLVSVVTVCYNSEDTIEKTIKSVLHQSYSNIEYLIIDGASKDRTVAIAEDYREAFKNRGYKFVVISEADEGIYDAMNKGINYASGELIGFINAGDWYQKEAVERAAREYEIKPYDYFYADINLVRSDGSVIIKHSRMDRIVTSRHWNHPSSFVTKALYDELGGFKCKGIHDDFEFFLRVRSADKKITIVNKVLANFKTGGTSNEKSLQMCRKRICDRYKGYRENGYSKLYLLECLGIEVGKYFLS